MSKYLIIFLLFTFCFLNSLQFKKQLEVKLNFDKNAITNNTNLNSYFYSISNNNFFVINKAKGNSISQLKGSDKSVYGVYCFNLKGSFIKTLGKTNSMEKEGITSPFSLYSYKDTIFVRLPRRVSVFNTKTLKHEYNIDAALPITFNFGHLYKNNKIYASSGYTDKFLKSDSLCVIFKVLPDEDFLPDKILKPFKALYSTYKYQCEMGVVPTDEIKKTKEKNVQKYFQSIAAGGAFDTINFCSVKKNVYMANCYGTELLQINEKDEIENTCILAEFNKIKQKELAYFKKNRFLKGFDAENVMSKMVKLLYDEQNKMFACVYELSEYSRNKKGSYCVLFYNKLNSKSSKLIYTNFLPFYIDIKNNYWAVSIKNNNLVLQKHKLLKEAR